MKINLNIVTVTRNDCESLKKTMNSIIHFARKNKKINIFHYIQDGDSKDNTKNFITKCDYDRIYSNYFLIFNSSKDNGIFDAMNLASKRFKRDDLVMYLNSGDELSNKINSTFFNSCLIDFFKRNKTLAFFRSKNIYKNTSYFMPPKSVKDTESFKKWIFSNTPVHQSVIFKVTDKYPLEYSLDFLIQSDSYLIYTILKKHSKPVFYDIELCKFELGGFSGNYFSFTKMLQQTKEQIQIMKLRGQGFAPIAFTCILMGIKFFLHNLLGNYFVKIHAKINRLIKN